MGEVIGVRCSVSFNIKLPGFKRRVVGPARGYWQSARFTNASVWHSPRRGTWPDNQMRAGHFCTAWVARLRPPLKPLLRHIDSTAVVQSGAPLSVISQRSRPATTRALVILGSE